MNSNFIPGLELSQLFYSEAVQPILDNEFPGLTYSAARVGSGSEVMGFDSQRSADHEWGPRLNLYLRPDELIALGTDITNTLSHQLPKAFRGHPTHFWSPDGGPIGHMTITEGPVNHRVGVTSLTAWFEEQLGFDPQLDITIFDWLAAPTQRLGENTAGAVFHDGLGVLNQARSKLTWYPHDVWRFVLACQWQRISQEEAFVGRAGEVGDELGSAVVAARLVRDIMRLCFLLERRWAPYSKWLGSAFSRLSIADNMQEDLTAVLSAETWKDREAPLARCYKRVADAQNALELTRHVDSATRRYHERPFIVLHAERFATELQQSIAGDELRHAPLTGAIDQFIDSTDVLSDPRRCRAIAAALYPALTGTRAGR